MAASDKRNERLNDWLREHNAIHLWHGTLKIQGTTQITAYSINGVVCLIHETSGGWEIYIPASSSTKVDDTLADAEKALGLEGSATCRNMLHALNEAARPK